MRCRGCVGVGGWVGGWVGVGVGGWVGVGVGVGVRARVRACVRACVCDTMHMIRYDKCQNTIFPIAEPL